MLNEKQEAEKNFYTEVARLLNCEQHVYSPWIYEKRTRWNHRNPGNGRYPGHGVVRRYSPTMIHVFLQSPRLNGTFSTDAAALLAIERVLAECAVKNNN